MTQIQSKMTVFNRLHLALVFWELKGLKFWNEAKQIKPHICLQEEGVDDVPVTKRMILERDEETKEVIIEVNKKLIRNLKPHQVEG